MERALHQNGCLLLLVAHYRRDDDPGVLCARDPTRNRRLFHLGAQWVLEEAGHAVAVSDGRWRVCTYLDPSLVIVTVSDPSLNFHGPLFNLGCN